MSELQCEEHLATKEGQRQIFKYKLKSELLRTYMLIIDLESKLDDLLEKKLGFTLYKPQGVANINRTPQHILEETLWAIEDRNSYLKSIIKKIEHCKDKL